MLKQKQIIQFYLIKAFYIAIWWIFKFVYRTKWRNTFFKRITFLRIVIILDGGSQGVLMVDILVAVDSLAIANISSDGAQALCHQLRRWLCHQWHMAVDSLPTAAILSDGADQALSHQLRRWLCHQWHMAVDSLPTAAIPSDGADQAIRHQLGA